MPVKYVIDTHALLWFLGGSSRLGHNAKAIMDNPASELILPAIALAEACWVLQKSSLGMSYKQLLEAIDADSRIVVYPLDRAIVERSLDLKAIGEMHDRQIAATVLMLSDQGEQIKLLTQDKNIVDSQLVEVTW